MGTRFLVLTSSPPPLPPINPKSSVYGNRKFSSDLRCSSPEFSARARRDSEAEAASDERFGFNSKFDFSGDGDGKFGFRSRERRRNWWSDEDDEDYDDEDDDLFGLFEEPSATDLVFKVFGAFAWTIPAVIISLIMGTGQNALIMALILPLGQSAISLVVDKIWGSSGYEPNPRRKTKRKPYVGTANKTKPGNKTRGRSDQATQERDTYQPWSGADRGSSKSGGNNATNFGGWDELDKQAENSSKFRGRPPGEDDNSKQMRTAKLSRRRKREKPLLLRLLIAVFPFLGSWTRLFL